MSEDIRDEDITIHVWPPSETLADRGGQHFTKSAVGVLVRHKPTGTAAICESERSMQANRERATAKLVELLSVDIVERVERETAEAIAVMIEHESDEIRKSAGSWSTSEFGTALYARANALGVVAERVRSNAWRKDPR